MFDAERGQIISPDEAVLAEDTSALLPLRDLLMADELPFKKGDFEKPDPKLWDRDRYLEVGKLVLAAIEQDGERRPITTEHLGRMAILGQVPDFWRFDKFFDNFTEYKQAVGSPIRYDRLQYADWGITDFVDYAKQTMKDLGHLPDIADYQQQFYQGKGPSLAMIRYRMGGGIRALHDRLGHPNTKGWDRLDFIDWGVKVMTANPGKDFSLNIVTALAADERGPSRQIITRCVKWSLLRAPVEHDFLPRPEAPRQSRDAKLNQYQSMIKQGTMPVDFLALPENELLAAGARYLVVQDCASDSDANKKRELCRNSSKSFIGRVRQLRPNLTAGYIEMVAVSLNVFDDIWPLNEAVEHFHVEQEKIDEIIKAQSLEHKHAQRRAKRAAQRAA